MKTKINCLNLALLNWANRDSMTILYNSNHAVCVEKKDKIKGYLNLSEFGYNNIANSFNGLLNNESKKLLKDYFKK